MLVLIVLKILLAFTAAYMTVGLVFSLRTGVVQYGRDEIGARANRSDNPVSFWIIWVVNLATVIFILWLIFR